MNDYPTRAEIDAAADVIERLQAAVDRGVPAFGVTWSGMETAREILTHLGEIPGLHYPEPEPKPTAAELLKFAYACTESRTPEQGIVYAAKCYAEAHPEWFAGWHNCKAANISLAAAAREAASAEKYVAFNLLNAAAAVARANPDLFGSE